MLPTTVVILNSSGSGERATPPALRIAEERTASTKSEQRQADGHAGEVVNCCTAKMRSRASCRRKAAAEMRAIPK